MELHQSSFLIHRLLLMGRSSFSCAYTDLSDMTHCQSTGVYSCDNAACDSVNQQRCRTHSCPHALEADYSSFLENVTGVCGFSPLMEVIEFRDSYRREGCKYDNVSMVESDVVECWTLQGKNCASLICRACSYKAVLPSMLVPLS